VIMASHQTGAVALPIETLTNLPNTDKNNALSSSVK
jgi:hypothetical protein